LDGTSEMAHRPFLNVFLKEVQCVIGLAAFLSAWPWPQVINLKFIEGFDTAQVARLMDKREGTIRALQLRALQSLRRELERQGERGSA
jgi:hypothetical protein